MRHTHFIFGIAMVAAAVLSGCRGSDQVAQNGTNNTSGGSPSHVAELTLPSGLTLNGAVNVTLTSETASVGSPWSGRRERLRSSTVGTSFRRGSPVAGTVTGVTAARKGDRAMLDLGLTSVTVDGRSYRVNGTTEAVIAGSPRARNLGAIAAGTAAGALIGRAVSGSGKGTLIGAVVGGADTTGAVSQTKGWQVVLKVGTPLTFTTNQAVAVRL
jgi:hypothetical protein